MKKNDGGRVIPKGSSVRADRNPTLRTTCAVCEKSIPTHVESSEGIRETWPLVVSDGDGSRVLARCTACHEAGRQPGQTKTTA